MQETRVQFLGWEDPLEKEMATHSSILAWRTPWRKKSGRLQSMVVRVRHNLTTKPPPVLALLRRLEFQSYLKETWIWSLSWEDFLEKGMATHSSILVWRIPWTGEPGGQQSMGSPRVGYDWVTNTIISYRTIKPSWWTKVTGVSF